MQWIFQATQKVTSSVKFWFLWGIQKREWLGQKDIIAFFCTSLQCAAVWLPKPVCLGSSTWLPSLLTFLVSPKMQWPLRQRDMQTFSNRTEELSDENPSLRPEFPKSSQGLHWKHIVVTSFEDCIKVLKTVQGLTYQRKILKWSVCEIFFPCQF